MIAQGAAWQHLRTLALSTIPDGTFVAHHDPVTIKNWLRSGTYVVTTSSSKEIRLSAASTEIASVLISESAYYLDHAAEHSVTIRNQLTSGNWNSTAWLCVTFYYWAYFSALSLTRLIGRTPLFLSKQIISDLRTLAGNPAACPGAGSFVVECLPSTTLSQTELVVRKSSRSRIHDTLWRVTFDLFSSLRKIASNGSTTDEDRLYTALVSSAISLGDSWPSDLRNLVNYSPGIGYGTVRKSSSIGNFGSLDANNCLPFERALERIESATLSLSRDVEIAEQTKLAASLLVDLTFAVDNIANSLLAEVVERRHIDKRWLNARREFVSQQFKHFSSPDWPYMYSSDASPP